MIRYYYCVFIFLNCASRKEHEEVMLIISDSYRSFLLSITVIRRLTKIIRSGITFVSRNLRQPKLLAVSNVNNPVGVVCLLNVMWSAHFFVTHIQTEKISSWNGPTVLVCYFMLARASTKTFVSRIHIRQPSPKNSEKKSSLSEKFVSRVTRQPRYHCTTYRNPGLSRNQSGHKFVKI